LPATCASPAQSACFVTAFANIGFSGDFGGSCFLSKLVGTGKARELYYTADRSMLFRSRPCPAVTVGSPVYFGNMMGEVKMFFDNWLLNPDRHLVNTDH
jgi:hypothetical protein